MDYEISYSIEEEGSLDAVMDMAVVIRTKHNAYTFSRGVWFGSEFTISKDDDISMKFTEKKCAEIWAGEPDENDPPEVHVTRTVTEL